MENREYSSASEICGWVSTLEADEVPMWSIACEGVVGEFGPDGLEDVELLFCVCELFLGYCH